jgi:phosphate transport system substrate-binding protein
MPFRRATLQCAMPTRCPSPHPTTATAVRTPFGPTATRRGVVRAFGRCAVVAATVPVGWVAQALDRPVRVGGTGVAVATMNSALAALAVRGRATPTQVLSNLGSVGSLRAVEQGALDMALISRPLLVDERMRGLHAVEYGRAPFALTTGMPGVTGLTRVQLAEMIEDPHATWPDGTPVRLVLRPKSDGDYVLLASMGPLVELALERASSRAGMVVAITDQEAVDAVARLRGGLGACGLPLLRFGSNSLTPLSLDGVAPTVANVENASYRIVNRMHVATKGPPAGLAADLISYLQAPEGQALLAQLGHSTRVPR